MTDAVKRESASAVSTMLRSILMLVGVIEPPEGLFQIRRIDPVAIVKYSDGGQRLQVVQRNVDRYSVGLGIEPIPDELEHRLPRVYGLKMLFYAFVANFRCTGDVFVSVQGSPQGLCTLRMQCIAPGHLAAQYHDKQKFREFDLLAYRIEQNDDAIYELCIITLAVFSSGLAQAGSARKSRPSRFSFA